MTRPVRFSRRAIRQLEALEAHIATEAGEARAIDYVGRLHGYCLSLGLFPQRGASRDDIRPGVRVVGWRRRASIMFVLRRHDVLILGVFHGGQDITFDA